MKIKLTWTDDKGSTWTMEGQGNVNLVTSAASIPVYTLGSARPIQNIYHPATATVDIDFEIWDIVIIPPAVITEDPLP